MSDVEQVLDDLDPTPAHEVDWPVSRRATLRALASVGALSVAPTAASAQSAGTVIADEAFLSNYDSTATASGYDVTIDGATFGFDGDETIALPDGASGTTVVTPVGAEAGEVVGPDGQTLWAGIPDSPPSSAVEQWPVRGYDGFNDAWRGQLNGFDLEGGSASKTTDENGNTVVSYDGTPGQAHTNSTIAVNYDRISIIIVANPDDTNTRMLWGDDTGASIYGQVGSGSARVNFGNNSGNNGGTASSLALYLFDGRLVGGTPENIIEENGTVLSTQTAGQTGFDGFMLGEYANAGLEFKGDVLEAVVYQDATDQDLSGEKRRLKDKYAGLSF